MTLIEGFPGVSARLVYSYRNLRIERRYRTHDVRNKTHNGYSWRVVYPNGAFQETTIRAVAKSLVDQHVKEGLTLNPNGD